MMNRTFVLTMRAMAKRLRIVLVYSLFGVLLLNSSIFGQISVKITAIDNIPIGSEEISVDEVAKISGTITFTGNDSTEMLLQVAWRKANDETWWIHDYTLSFMPKVGQTIPWEIKDMPIGTRFDYKRNMEVVAFAIPRGEYIPEGVIDYNSMLYLSAGITRQIAVVRRTKTPAVYSVTPRIRMGYIAGKPVKIGETHEVGLNALVSGEVRKPTDSVVLLVVQPLNSDEHWIMEDEVFLRNGRWSGKFDFTKYGFEEDSEFIVFAIVARQLLPRGEAIPLAAWHEHMMNDISGISTLHKVRRIEIPVDKNQIGIKILTIDDRPVDPDGHWEVRPQCGIKGMLTGRNLLPSEALLILVASEFGDPAWQQVGRARVKNGRFWEISPRKLGPPGQYLKVMAVVASGGVQLISDRIEENVAFSAPIHILTKDQPPLSVQIERVDKKAIQTGNDAGIDVFRVSSVSGRISGRPLETDDKIWVLKMPNEEEESWELIGRAGFKSRHIWELPPMSLGESGDELILVAVVSKNKVDSMNLQEQGKIQASSARVHIRLTDE